MLLIIQHHISLNDIDESNEWLLGKISVDQSVDVEDELVFDDDDDAADTLTWGVAANTADVGESRKNTTFQTKSRSISKDSILQQNLEKLVAESKEIEEDNVDVYNSGLSGLKLMVTWMRILIMTYR